MFLDNGLTFNSAVGTAQTVTTTADSTGIIDVTGAGSGTAPAMINGFPNANTAIGEDYGVGDGVTIPWVIVAVKTAPTSTTNTLTVSLKSAPDDGSYGQGTYTTIASTGAITGANLTAGTLIAFQVPPKAPGAAMPRFYKLTYTASATLTPMAVYADLVLNPESSLVSGQYGNNYLVV